MTKSSWRFYFQFIALVLFPLLIAVCIYIFLRPQALQLIGGLELLHYPIGNHCMSNAHWFLYNLPDGLWAFSFESFLFLSFINDQLWLRVTILIIGITIMLLLEYLQKTWLPGTFDSLDIFSILIGAIFSVILSVAANLKRE